jgi:hypothetical protein
MEHPPLNAAQDRALDRWMKQSNLGFALDRGLGKTRVAQLGMHLQFEVDKWLVVAPGRVARLVWPAEAEKWGYLNRGRMRVLSPSDFDMHAPTTPADAPAGWAPAGAPRGWQSGELIFRDVKATRAHLRGLVRDNDVIVVPVNWLSTLAQALTVSPFAGMVFDESGYARNKDTLVWRGARHFAVQARTRLMMNGVPFVKNYEGLWAQTYLIDEGAALGRGLGDFRGRYLRPTDFGPGGHVRAYGNPTESQLEALHAEFHRLWIVERRTDDMGAELQVLCELDGEHWGAASQFLRGAIAACAGHDVLPANAGVGWAKAIQVCNGRVYDEHKDTIHLHSNKLDALEEILETTERGVLALCWWDHDHAAVLKRLGKRAISIKVKGGLESWMAGKQQVLVAHPRAASHGLNLQAVGHTLIWLGLHPDVELYLQACARFPRAGQTHPVVIYRLMTAHPAERAVWNTLTNRMTALEALLQAGREI